MYDKEKKGEIPTSILGIVMKNLGHNLKADQLAECIDAVDGDGMFIKFILVIYLVTYGFFIFVSR